jgi:hypothetical protein
MGILAFPGYSGLYERSRRSRPYLVHQKVSVGSGLLQGVFNLFRLAVQGKDKMVGIGFLDLIKRPILDFEDGQAGVFAKEDEIWLAAVDVGQVLGRVSAVWPGNGLQKSVELAFAVGGEVGVVGDHGGHTAFFQNINGEDRFLY